MAAPPIELIRVDVGEIVGFADLALACELSRDDLLELVEFGAVQPLEATASELEFASSCIDSLRTAEKLRRDYDLDLFVVVIVMDYLRRIEFLESKIRSMQKDF